MGSVWPDVGRGWLPTWLPDVRTAAAFRGLPVIGVGPLPAGEQVALVVVAPQAGQDQVLHGVDAAADPRDEMIGFRGAAERPVAVEAAAVLQRRDAVSQRAGRQDPV